MTLLVIGFRDMTRTRNVAPVWNVPVIVDAEHTYTFLLVVDEVMREEPRLDDDHLRKLARDSVDIHGYEPEPADVGAHVRAWTKGSVRPLHELLARAADERRRPGLEPAMVERFAQYNAPPYRIRGYRRGTGTRVYAQVAHTIAERVAAELVDLLRLDPVLSRCRRCGRISVGQCRAYLATGKTIVASCDGVEAAPANERTRKTYNAMRRRRQRLLHAMEQMESATERGYLKKSVAAIEKDLAALLGREFPARARGPLPRLARSAVSPKSDQPASTTT